MFFTAIFILICIAMLATASIGMECYNKHDAWKNSHTSNYKYLIAAIVLPVAMIIAAGISIYLEVKTAKLRKIVPVETLQAMVPDETAGITQSEE